MSTSDKEQQKSNEWTEFGYSFACLSMALLLFAAPRYMALPTAFGDIAGLILSLVCYFAAVVFAIFVFSFASR